VLAWPHEGQAAAEMEGIGSFGASGGETPAPIASVAKVMTAYLTLREHPLATGEDGFVVRITPMEVEEQEQRAALGESTVAMKAGERITERQALEALLLPSANNIAALLAMYEPGGLAAFVARMNSTARKLGMNSSTYTDPSGFDDTTVSTAVDQLRLARVAMRIPAFAEIVDEPAAELPGVGRITNYDGLLGTGGYIGVKTGSDRAAGGCFVFAKQITIGGRRLTMLGVVLGQRGSSLIEAALVSADQLADSAAASLRVRTVLPAGTSVLSASSVDGRGTTGATAAALREIGWGGVELPVQLAVRPSMTHLQAGESMATVTIRGARATRTRAVAVGTVGGPSIGWRLRHLL
jgi:serine-type D-Ala-D-Ala carboxypeptidase (penicillin-binding protein 5/6)